MNYKKLKEMRKGVEDVLLQNVYNCEWMALIHYDDGRWDYLWDFKKTSDQFTPKEKQLIVLMLVHSYLIKIIAHHGDDKNTEAYLNKEITYYIKHDFKNGMHCSEFRYKALKIVQLLISIANLDYYD